MTYTIHATISQGVTIPCAYERAGPCAQKGGEPIALRPTLCSSLASRGTVQSAKEDTGVKSLWKNTAFCSREEA